jgi:alginate O-acetyltransferase complex protein AlgI
MNFADSQFWILLLAGVGVIAFVRLLVKPGLGPKIETFDKCALMSLGLFLLLCVSWITFIIFLVVALVSYWGLLWIVRHHQPERRKHYLLVLIPLQLLPLLYYKYANFALNDVLSLNYDSLRHLIIPVGISFYTFQKVAFVVDTLAFDAPLPRFLSYMNFAGFFPQIVAGPIERRESLLPQMERFRFRWDPASVNEGAVWIAVGLFFKCCLADNLAIYVDGTSSSNPFAIWLANLLFGLRIYYDFAGYSLIAVGLARCIGITLTLNFLSPYCSSSIVEFWRRWHVTLSQWFRDYVYVPLGGGRTERWMFNVFLVFIISGIWHGAGWNFMIWGALHGGALVVNRVVGQKLNLPRVVAWLLTLFVAFFAWLAFYETRTGVLFAKMKTIVTPAAYTMSALGEALSYKPSGDQFVLACLLLLTGTVLFIEWLSVAKKNEPYHFLRQPWAAALAVVLTVLLAPGQNNGFIYFAF